MVRLSHVFCYRLQSVAGISPSDKEQILHNPYHKKLLVSPSLDSSAWMTLFTRTKDEARYLKPLFSLSHQSLM